MSAIDTLLLRAGENGIAVSGVTPTVRPGRGIGVVATRDLDRGDIIMSIPVEAVRSLHTVPEDITRRLSPNMSIHGLLAAELALSRNITTDWVHLVPQWTDFEAVMPMLWPKELQGLLPMGAKQLVIKQRARFEVDWKNFRTKFKKEKRRSYLYAWLLVNTRTFYFETPSTMVYPWHDRLALLPIADLFNHTDTGCSVSSTTESYTITVDRPYCAGDEVCISYGEHSNDFLLAEYGFILQENRWDKVCLDDLILLKLNSKRQSELKENGYLGDFMLQAGSKKHDSLWIALRLLCCVDAQWQSYIDGEEDAEGTLQKAAELLPAFLEEYLAKVKETLTAIHMLKAGKPCQRDLLVQRWEQIGALIRQAAVTR